MSAPAVDLFADHNTIDHVDRTVDSLTATATALGVLALASWVAAIVAVRLNADAGNVVLGVGLSAVISICSAMCWCVSMIRHHNRRMAEALCYRIEQDLELRRRTERPTEGPDESWRAYLAGRIDRDDDR